MDATQFQFIDNKYTTWYFNIISSATYRKLPNCVYTETHHIVPKSLGGTNNLENLIVLTGKEHFICHLLLSKMTTGQAKAKMCYASMQLCMINNRDRYNCTSRIYAMIRNEYSKSLKGVSYNNRYGINKATEIKRKIGEKSKGRKPMLGKLHSVETKQRISIIKTGISLPKSLITRNRISVALKNCNLDRKGSNNGMFNKHQSDKTKQLISTANSGKNNGMYEKYKHSLTIECPHCAKTGKDGPNFIRWHFNNCKRKII